MELVLAITLLLLCRPPIVTPECSRRGAGTLECRHTDMDLVVGELDASLHTLHLVDVDMDDDVLRPTLFANATNVRELHLVDCDIETVLAFAGNETVNDRLRTISLRDNDLETYYQTLSSLTQWWPSLIAVDLSDNHFDDVADDNATAVFLANTHKVLSLNTSLCRLTEMPTLPANLVTVDLSRNAIASTSLVVGARLQFVNVSHNAIASMGSLRGTPRLQSLDISYNFLEMEPSEPPPSLQYMDMRANRLRHANMSTWSGRGMRHVDLSANGLLSSVDGHIGAHLRFVSLAHARLSTLPIDFLHAAREAHVDLRGNRWWCGCQAQWHSSMHALPPGLLVDLACSSVDEFDHDTAPHVSVGTLDTVNTSSCAAWGSSLGAHTILRYVHGTDARLDCHVYGRQVAIEWWRLEPREQLARWDGGDGAVLANHSHKYSLIAGGQLLVHSFARSDIDTYACVLDGHLVRNIQARADLSYWFEHVEVYSVVCGVVTCLVAFTLHMIYSTMRRLIMWRIDRAERTHRVRNMLEAMEKYRARQMEQAYAAYAVKTTVIRENYHEQVEQLWTSYMSQTTRIKDYKAAQIDAMSEHWGKQLESLASFTSQVVRMREYGRGQMEKMGENYERRMNKIRTFSLEQRLKLARQYHFKNGYLNKLAESLSIEWPNRAPDSTLPEPPNVPMNMLHLEAGLTSTYHSMEDIDNNGHSSSHRSSVHSDLIESIVSDTIV